MGIFSESVRELHTTAPTFYEGMEDKTTRYQVGDHPFVDHSVHTRLPSTRITISIVVSYSFRAIAQVILAHGSMYRDCQIIGLGDE